MTFQSFSRTQMRKAQFLQMNMHMDAGVDLVIAMIELTTADMKWNGAMSTKLKWLEIGRIFPEKISRRMPLMLARPN